MAAKRRNLSDYDKNIQDLMNQIEKTKKEKKAYEDKIKLEIGKVYFEIISLNDKSIDVDFVLEDLKEQLKENRLKQKNDSHRKQSEETSEEP